MRLFDDMTRKAIRKQVKDKLSTMTKAIFESAKAKSETSKKKLKKGY